MIKAFRERHDYVVSALNKIDGVTCLPADGTFYVFPHVQEVIDRLDGVNDDIELAEYLLDEAGVALVPGSAFGAPGYVRISFATSMEVLNDALTRLANALTP
jgi:aspartate aminotransferase